MLPRQIQNFSILNFYEGLNLLDSPNSIRPAQCLSLQNFRFGNSNMLEPMGGFSAETIMTSAEGDGIEGIYRYNTVAGDRHNLFVKQGILYDNVESEYDLRYSAFDAGCQYDWEQYLDLVYISNGTNRQRAYRYNDWDNPTGGVEYKTRQTGLPVPTPSVAAAITSTGGNLPSGTYKFLCTLEMSSGVTVESNPNATETEATVAAGDEGKITISFTNPDPAPDAAKVASTLNIYASDTDGSVLWWLTAIDLTGDGTYTHEWGEYTDLSVNDSALEYDNFIPPVGTQNRIYNNHMFIGGNPDNPNYLYISKFCRLEQFPGAIPLGDPVASSYIIDLEDNFVAMFAVKNGGLLVLCRNSIQLITGVGVTSFSRTYLTRAAGCSGMGTAACGSDGIVYWRGWDDFYASDGANIYPIGKYVWPQVKNLGENAIGKSRGFYYDHCYYYTYPNLTSYNDSMIHFDTRFPSSDLGTFGAWLGIHTDIHLNCFTKSKLEGENIAYFGDSNRHAVWRWDYGNGYGTDIDGNDVSIKSKLISGIMYFNATDYTKRWHTIGAEVAPTSASPVARIEFNYGRHVETVSLATSQEDSSLYDSAVYDTSKYGASNYEYVNKRLSQDCQGECAQLEISVDNKNRTSGTPTRSFALRNLGMQFSIIRRFRG